MRSPVSYTPKAKALFLLVNVLNLVLLTYFSLSAVIFKDNFRFLGSIYSIFGILLLVGITLLFSYLAKREGNPVNPIKLNPRANMLNIVSLVIMLFLVLTTGKLKIWNDAFYATLVCIPLNCYAIYLGQTAINFKEETDLIDDFDAD
ncbi:MAG: hypothetical protein IT222_12680 [Crocinitomix sp.]|nr:hypothetical protein [Crocinitomix sp.]